MRAVFVLVLALFVVACSAAPEVTLQPSEQPTPAATATTGPTPAPSPGPTAPVTPLPTVTPPDTSAFDGLWASRPLTREMMIDALTTHGVDAARFDEYFPDFERIDYRMAEARIGDGNWDHSEYADGVPFGGWRARIASASSNTIVVSDDEIGCTVTFALTRTGDQLSVAVEDDRCPDDLLYQVAIYEASTFTLVEAANWTPPEFTPSPPLEGGPSTSGQRQVARPKGTVAEAPLGYLEYLPTSYSDDGAPSPLLLFFHGSGESGRGDEVALTLLRQAGIPNKIDSNNWPDDRPFVVLSPQHEEVPPDYCMEADEIDAFIRFAIDHYNVDAKRVYLTALSCGAMGIWNYLDKYGGNAIAAAIPIAGNGLVAIQNDGCALGATPIWAFHGAVDENVPVDGEVYPLIVLQGCTNPAPVDARLTVFPFGAHDVWTRTYGGSDGIDIYSWLLGHERSH